jgi:hypothetical protein
MLGRCYTACNLRRRKAKEVNNELSLKYRDEIQVYVHQPGEEFWLISPHIFPMEVGTFTLQIQNNSEIVGAEIKITRKDHSQLNQESTPCLEHQENRNNYMYRKFIECCKRQIWSKVAGLDVLIDNQTKMGVCQDNKSAADTLNELHKQLNQFSVSPAKYGCPMPCRHTSYELKVNYVHMNVWFDWYNLTKYPKGSFSVGYYYESLDVKERIENLVMDVSGLLAEAGGNIGLLLGFSLISLLFSLIKCCKHILEK